MRIVMTGSTGLVGQFLVDQWKDDHELIRLVRPQSKVRPDAGTFVEWDPYNERLDPSVFEGCDAVIHLAGASIAGKRWSPEYKQIIRDSRVLTTRFLVKTLLENKVIPEVFISASAIGYYGDRPKDVELDEDAPPGEGFLAETCVEWEKATEPLQAHTRVINTRFGIILSTKGGALARMLMPFRFGLGGIIGNGEQVMSWVSLPEIPEILNFIIMHENIQGPVNVTTPQPVTNAEFTRTLARVLRRPAFFHVPSFAIRWILGEMGDSLLLSGQRVIPKRLVHAGYRFQYESLEQALHYILDKKL